MSNMDGTDDNEKVENAERVEKVEPEETNTSEEFDKAIEGRREDISREVRNDDRLQNDVCDMADNMSSDEINKKRDELGDPKEKLEAYRDAVFGDHPDWTSEQRADAIESAKADWESDTAAREMYNEALDMQDVDNVECPGEGDSDDGGDKCVSEEEPVEQDKPIEGSDALPEGAPDSDENLEQGDDGDGDPDSSSPDVSGAEPGFERGAREMSRQDKEAYGVDDASIRENTNDGLKARLDAEKDAFERYSTEKAKEENGEEDSDQETTEQDDQKKGLSARLEQYSDRGISDDAVKDQDETQDDGTQEDTGKSNSDLFAMMLRSKERGR